MWQVMNGKGAEVGRLTWGIDAPRTVLTASSVGVGNWPIARSTSFSSETSMLPLLSLSNMLKACEQRRRAVVRRVGAGDGASGLSTSLHLVVHLVASAPLKMPTDRSELLLLLFAYFARHWAINMLAPAPIWDWN
jgi:hypothetical protein